MGKSLWITLISSVCVCVVQMKSHGHISDPFFQSIFPSLPSFVKFYLCFLFALYGLGLEACESVTLQTMTKAAWHNVISYKNRLRSSTAPSTRAAKETFRPLFGFSCSDNPCLPQNIKEKSLYQFSQSRFLKLAFQALIR